jgi:alkanesulfonate monooxygenase
MPANPPRFGIWAFVHGSRAALQDPDEPYDASWTRNRELILEAERLGFDATLIAQHTINPHDEQLDQLAAKDASLRAVVKQNSDPRTVMDQTFNKSARVGTNGGTAAGLVGSYATVAERIAAFHRAGLELFMLQFEPFETDMKRFANEVIPRVRELAAS